MIKLCASILTLMVMTACFNATPTSFTDFKRANISNGIITVGINLEYGGIIDEIIYKGINRVDKGFGRGDPGRQIQASLYDSNDPASGPNWTDPNWPWNPVQGGNRIGKPSILLEKKQLGATSYYTKTLPQQWNDTLGLADVLIEQWVAVSGNSVILEYRVTHTGDDEHGRTAHEFPVIYLKPTLNFPITILDGIATKEEYWLRGGWVGITDIAGEGIFVIPDTMYNYHFEVVTNRGDNDKPNRIQVWTKFGFGPAGTPESIRETKVRLLFGTQEEI